MLTITLSAEDLGNVRFASAPAPVLETVLLLFELRHRPHRPGSDWRGLVRASFPAQARPLLNLVADRSRALFLDVLTPDPDEVFRRLRTTPQPVHHRNVDRISRLNQVPLPTWLRRYGAGDAEVIRVLDRALRSFHAACLAPQWRSVSQQFHSDVAHRAAVFHQRGTIGMLRALSPDLLVSQAPEAGEVVLRSPYPWDRAERPAGRGLVLVPSAFWTGHPLITWDPLDPAQYVLIYPAHGAPPAVTVATSQDPLAALLGATRATVLRTLAEPRTTTGIARYANISPSSASEHAATLRDAGLLTSHRRGQATEHRLTQLGHALLRTSGAARPLPPGSLGPAGRLAPVRPS